MKTILPAIRGTIDRRMLINYRVPAGAIHLDCALLMENIEHDWRTLPRIEGPL
jgi:hypothetical protein